MYKIVTDNDGVNVDSEDVAMRVMDDWGVALIQRYNPGAASELPPDYIYKKYAGTSTDKIVDALITDHKLPLDQIIKDYQVPPDETVSGYLAHLITLETNERFKKMLTSIPGITKAWTQIVSQVGAENIALATTSRQDRMDISLECAIDPETGENARLAKFFPVGHSRFSGYDFPNKYDAFFQATGWDPANTIIFEDSESGVTKGKKGRPDTPVVGIVAARFYEDKDAQAQTLLDVGASIVVAHALDLPKAVQWIENGMIPQTKPEFKSKTYLPPSRTETRYGEIPGIHVRPSIE